MSNAQHTPGPWRVGETRHAGGYQLVMAEARSRGFVAEVQAPIIDNCRFDEAAREANANLIAAAPDLLAVLRALAAPEKWQNAPHDLLRQAQAAIALAEGRSND